MLWCYLTWGVWENNMLVVWWAWFSITWECNQKQMLSYCYF